MPRPIGALPHEHHTGERMLSCGRSMFGGYVRVDDAEGSDLPPRQVGERFYRGESLMSGYWQREKETAQAIREGWFHTGDAG
jgi:long-subunit acyl-CoA synthetase (AMP-forming)